MFLIVYIDLTGYNYVNDEGSGCKENRKLVISNLGGISLEA